MTTDKQKAIEPRKRKEVHRSADRRRQTALFTERPQTRRLRRRIRHPGRRPRRLRQTLRRIRPTLPPRRTLRTLPRPANGRRRMAHAPHHAPRSRLHQIPGRTSARTTPRAPPRPTRTRPVAAPRTNPAKPHHRATTLRALRGHPRPPPAPGLQVADGVPQTRSPTRRPTAASDPGRAASHPRSPCHNRPHPGPQPSARTLLPPRRRSKSPTQRSSRTNPDAAKSRQINHIRPTRPQAVRRQRRLTNSSEPRHLPREEQNRIEIT